MTDIKITPLTADEANKISNLQGNEGFQLLIKSLEAKRVYHVLSAAKIMSETPTPNGQADAYGDVIAAHDIDKCVRLIKETVGSPKWIKVTYE